MPIAAQSQDISEFSLQISGPGWTKPVVIERGFSQKLGQPFDSKALWEDVARVQNFEIFQSVTASVAAATDSVSIDVQAIDRWSVFPVFQPTYGGDVFHLILGVREANFLGRAQDVTIFGGAYVSDSSSGWIGGGQWLHRQLANRHQLALSLQRNYGVDNFYHHDISAISQIERRVVSALAHFVYRRFDYWQPGVYAYVIDNKFRHLAGIPIPDGNIARALSIRPGLLLKAGKVNYRAFMYEGVDAVFDLFPDIRLDGPSGFWGSSLQIRGFLRPHHRLNLAGRYLVQARNNKHQIDDLAYGGFSHIRSYPSSYLRGNYGAVLNAEARLTLFPRLFNTFFVQSVVFYDAAAAGNGPLFVDWAQKGHSVGGGFRGAVHQIVGVFGRIDVARSLTSSDWRVGIGVSQFF